MEYIQRVCQHTYLRRVDNAVICAVCSLHFQYVYGDFWKGTFERAEFEKAEFEKRAGFTVATTTLASRVPTYEI